MVYRRAKREEAAVLNHKPTKVPPSSTSNLAAQRRPGTQIQSLVLRWPKVVRSEAWWQLTLKDKGVGLYSERYISWVCSSLQFVVALLMVWHGGEIPKGVGMAAHALFPG